jgi:DNA-binding Xre family transcriptional regulator
LTGFRHLDYGQGPPLQELGPAALDSLLERGDFGDWRPLARAVLRDPRGALADRVLRVCRGNPDNPSSSLWRHWIEGLRQPRLSQAPRPGRTLAELRRDRGLTQAELAARLGISQSDVSKLERRDDLRLSTLRAYVEALGMDLEVSAVDAAALARGRDSPAQGVKIR